MRMAPESLTYFNDSSTVNPTVSEGLDVATEGLLHWDRHRGFKIPYQPQLAFSPSLLHSCGSDLCSQLLLQYGGCLSAAMLSTMTAMDSTTLWNCEPKLNALFSSCLGHSVIFFSNRKVAMSDPLLAICLLQVLQVKHIKLKFETKMYMLEKIGTACLSGVELPHSIIIFPDPPTYLKF